jgi:hypothetical protein
MNKKGMKVAALAALLGTMFAWSSCLTQLLYGGLAYTGFEFLLDNNDILNIWSSGDVQ